MAMKNYAEMARVRSVALLRAQLKKLTTRRDAAVAKVQARYASQIEALERQIVLLRNDEESADA